MTGAPRRLVLVGAGGFAETWWPALGRYAAQLEVAGVAEPDPEARARFAGRFGIGAACQADTLTAELLRAAGADVVIDCSPPWCRREVVRTTLAWGAQILTAKPFGRSAAEAREMLSLVRRASDLCVAQQMRYFPCFRTLRSLVADGLLGQIRSATLQLALDGRGWTPGMAWRLAMKHPLLLEAGIHHLDLLRWCLGAELQVVSAREFNPPWSPFEHPAAATVLLRTTDGAQVHYDASFAPNPRRAPVRFDSGWSVLGDSATAEILDGAVFVDGHLIGAGPTDAPVGLEDLNVDLMADWLIGLDGGATPSFTAADNEGSMALLSEVVAHVEMAGRPSPDRVAA